MNGMERIAEFVVQVRQPETDCLACQIRFIVHRLLQCERLAKLPPSFVIFHLLASANTPVGDRLSLPSPRRPCKLCIRALQTHNRLKL